MSTRALKPTSSGLILPYKMGPGELRNPTVREVPLDDERLLAEISPRSETESWLKLLWEPGYPWEHVERFMVYQMIPDARVLVSGGRRKSAIPEMVLEQLQHPKPPSQMGNYYDTVKKEFVRNPDCLITERAYWMYREWTCWGKPFWVVQGSEGGHKRFFSEVEKKFLRMANLPTDPPAPGDLPYAPFDLRVVNRLMQHDLLLAEQGSLRHSKRILAGAYNERYEANERAFRERLVKWLADQMTEAAEGVVESLQMLDAPRSKRDPRTFEIMAERAEQNFIETGRTHGGADLSKSHT